MYRAGLHLPLSQPWTIGDIGWRLVSLKRNKSDQEHPVSAATSTWKGDLEELGKHRPRCDEAALSTLKAPGFDIRQEMPDIYPTCLAGGPRCIFAEL